MPPRRTRELERAVRLACSAEPALVCLQELPAAALSRLDAWTGYRAHGAVAMRPRLPSELALRLTDLRPTLFRAALEGQANAILSAPGLQACDPRTIVLNTPRFRERVARELRLGWWPQMAWAKERRVCHAVRVALEDGRTVLVANLHATSYRSDKRIADAELRRAATFADALAEPAEPVVLAGDFNVTTASSPTLRELSGPEWGFSAAGPGLDHVLVRGLRVSREENAWPDERRRHGPVLLSDHAAVEVEVE